MTILIAALLLASSAWTQTEQQPTKSFPQQGLPPKNLAVKADGHISANQDPGNAEKFEVHVVKAGETLSQIAGEVLKNSRLWPQLWEQNEHIVNPHWIYPNDVVLIKPVTAITEAKPTEPDPEPLPQPQPVAELPRARLAPPAPDVPVQERVQSTFVVDEQKPASEIKFGDLYCSGSVQAIPLPKNLRVISKFDASGGVLATDTDYVYLSQGERDGVEAGNVYQVVRPTRTMTNPKGRSKEERDLGMHYLDIAQLRVVLVQPDFSLARVTHNCADAVDVGDILVPFQQIVFPMPERHRPFSPTMTAASGVTGTIVSTKDVMLSFGSAFKGSGHIPGVPGGRLGPMERGLASQGMIVYIDVGQDKAVTAGDVFIVYRNVEVDRRLYDLPKEVKKLKTERRAIGELVVVKTGERAATALVTYSSDALALGDSVERR